MTDQRIKEIEIRELRADDASLIENFFDCMGKESRAVFNRRDYNRRGILRACRTPDGCRRYFLALWQGIMVGYVFFLDWNTSIPELGIAVRDDWQGRGLGHRLMEFAKERVRTAHKGGIQLTTHVANLRAQVLYESVGFVCMGSCKNGTELFYLLRFIKE